MTQLFRATRRLALANFPVVELIPASGEGAIRAEPMGAPSPDCAIEGEWDAYYWWEVRAGTETSQIFALHDRASIARKEGLCLVTNGDLHGFVRPEAGNLRRFELGGVVASVQSHSRAWILQRGYTLKIGPDVTINAEFPGWLRHNRIDLRVQGTLSPAQILFVALALLTAGPSS